MNNDRIKERLALIRILIIFLLGIIVSAIGTTYNITQSDKPLLIGLFLSTITSILSVYGVVELIIYYWNLSGKLKDPTGGK